MTPTEIIDRLRDPAAMALAGPTEADGAEALRPERMIAAAVLVPIVLHPQK